MSSSLVVELSDEVRSALDEAVRIEGVSASEIIDRALKRHLSIRRFRQLRTETMAYMHAIGYGGLTDEDVFRMDSTEDVEDHCYVREKLRSSLERADTQGGVDQDLAEARLAKWLIDDVSNQEH